MIEQGAYGEQMGKYFRLDNVPTVSTRTLMKSRLAVTRLRSAAPAHGMTTPIPKEDAFCIILYLKDMLLHKLWLGGREVPMGTRQNGTVCIVPLERETVAYLETPFDFMQFYLPRAALNEIADEFHAPRIETLRLPVGVSVRDPVVNQLASLLLPALEQPQQANRLFVDYVTLALQAHFAHTYGGMQIPPQAVVGGLAPWQERRAKDLMNAHLDGDIPLARLAAECGLSVSQFGRAFKKTTNVTPHRWLLHQRVEAAKCLLRHSSAPIMEIAFACGFAGQSHFTRVFTRSVGISPGAWRREQRIS